MSPSTNKTSQAEQFILLTEYDAPSLPTKDAFQIFLERFKGLIKTKEEEPQIYQDNLQSAILNILDKVAAPPACGPLLHELKKDIEQWIQTSSQNERFKVLAFPPGFSHELIYTWTKQERYHLLSPPKRNELFSTQPLDTGLKKVNKNKIIIIPELERYYVRHHNGLNFIEKLLNELMTLPNRVVISCNTWAWHYFEKVLNIRAVLPEPSIFQAFNEKKLHQWFSEIAKQQESYVFLSQKDGKNVLSNEYDQAYHPLLKTLAGRSEGIPWVAWHLWRKSIHIKKDIPPSPSNQSKEKNNTMDCLTASDKKTSSPNNEFKKQTLWITALEEFSLPGGIKDDSLFILHTLLMHESLDEESLLAILPYEKRPNTLNALFSAGFIKISNNKEYYCNPEAYVSIKKGLKLAGFPMPII